MNIFKAYAYGFKLSWKSPKMIGLIYLTNLFLALIVVLPFYSVLKNGVGDSMSVNQMLKNFDYTVFMDFMNHSSDAVNGLFQQIKWIALFYWILSIFFNGGILKTFTKEKFTMTNFFSGAGYNFIRFLALSLVMIAIQIIIALLIYTPAYIYIKYLLETSQSEFLIYRTVIAGIGIHILSALVFLIIADYAKFYILLNDSFNILKAVWKSINYVFRNFHKTYTLYLLLLIIPALIFYLYLNLDNDIGMTSLSGIIVMIIIQQVFIILRVWMRIWLLGGQFELYASDLLKSEKNKITIQNNIELDIKAQALGKKMALDEVIGKISVPKYEEQELSKAGSVQQESISQDDEIKKILEEEITQQTTNDESIIILDQTANNTELIENKDNL